MDLQDIDGTDLGGRTVAYGERDAILYALAVGAPSERLDLVYERDLRVLPTYACALGLWAVEKAGGLGAYDRTRSLHATQKLVMHGAMPPAGEIAMTGRVAGVWDKGRAAVVDIEVASAVFTATYSVFLPGVGGWGGERGPAAGAEAEAEAEAAGRGWTGGYRTWPDQAAIYRLTGDPHPIHIDPEVARANGFEKPILHGLCTLAIAARELAAAAGAHPADLRMVEARLSAPVVPGDEIAIEARRAGDGLAFEARVGEAAVLKAGRAVFAAG